jgi:exosortase
MTLVKRHCLFGAYCLGVALLYGEVLGALFRYSQRDTSASHLVLIPFISAALVYQARQTVFSAVQSAVAAGGCLIAAGGGLFFAVALSRSSGHADAWIFLTVMSLVVVWVGGFLAFYGYRASRAALFPLAFLVFTIPVPAVLLREVIGALKSGSADAVAYLFTLTGTVYHREGFLFHLPNLTIEIADACSGIRSSIALMLTGLLAGHLFLDASWKKTLLVALVLPITILKNAIRIVTLTLLSIHVDPSFLQGELHRDGGVVFFVLGLALMAPMLSLLARMPRRLVSVKAGWSAIVRR